MVGVPPGLIRINVNARIEGGEQMVHTFYGLPSATGATSPAQLQAQADWLVTCWMGALNTAQQGGNLGALLSGRTVYQSIDAYGLEAATGHVVEQVNTAFPAGANGEQSASLPNDSAMCCTLLTGTFSRSGRGRTFLGGLGQNCIGNDGRFTAPKATSAAQALSYFLAQAKTTANGVTIGVYSRKNQSLYPVKRVQVGDVPDVQRRRSNGLVEARVAHAV